jgi:polyhydroxybutyrate depolymerase
MKRTLGFLLAVFPLLAVASGNKPHPVKVEVLAAAAEPRAAGWHEQTMDVAGVERVYRCYVPSNAPAHPAVVVLLHGGQQSMREIFDNKVGGARGWLTLAEHEGFLLLTPNGTNPENGDTMGDDQIWNDLRAPDSKRRSTNDDVRFVGQLLDWAAATLGADTNRAYVTGASNGGMMTYRLLVDTPERFAAGAAFVAALPGDLTRAHQPARPVPLMIANATKDPMIKWEGGFAPGKLRIASTPDTLAWWIKANHANPDGAKEEALPDTDPKDKCRIYKTEYPALDGGAPVLFYRIEGGSHSMPSKQHLYREGPIIQKTLGLARDVEGAEIAWDFMKQFSLTTTQSAERTSP